MSLLAVCLCHHHRTYLTQVAINFTTVRRIVHNGVECRPLAQVKSDKSVFVSG